MQLRYDKEIVNFEVSNSRLIRELLPNPVEVDSIGVDEVRRALLNPIGSKKLSELVKAGEKVCIITSDITRPMPSKVCLPPLLDELNQSGVKDSDILIVFALGSHRNHTEEEMRYLVGDEVYDRIECVDSNPDRCKRIGVTSKGTVVDIFDRVVDSDFIICMGNIEYHYFAGYSGGAKAIMPGVSTKEAIRQNHKMMVDPSAYAGNLNSPVRLDIEEAGELLGIDFILNVVLDEHKQIIKAVAGHPVKAHRVGCAFLDELYSVGIKEKANIVVVSAGGYPKDQNMYQAQKALDNAKHAVKDGGIIIWLASCKEGLGSAVFEQWMTTKSPKQMIEDIKKDFKLGGHKAAAISLVLENARIFMVSDLPDELIKGIHLEPFGSLNDAFIEATKILGEDSTVYVMPYGGSTLPKEL
ncbi:MAG: nickel-dependent lactate racemase [Clostridia bacterium]|nr:nickel-dependent lactate racemase [Clostridia bacterium]